MKRVFNALVVSILAFSAFGVMSCKDAIVDDGTNIKSYVSSTGGAGGAVPFHMFNDKMDYQLWDGTVTATTNKTEAIFTSASINWWGGVICIDSAVNDAKATEVYDFTGIDKMTFFAKADKEGKAKFGICTEDSKVYDLTTEYPENPFEYSVKDFCTTEINEVENGSPTGRKIVPGYKHYSLFYAGGAMKDVSHYVKDIRYFDASGAEVVPSIVKK